MENKIKVIHHLFYTEMVQEITRERENGTLNVSTTAKHVLSTCTNY